MHKKGDQSIHIAGSASFCPEKKKKNNLVWKDKNGFIKKKYGFITFFVITQQYHTKWWIIYCNQVTMRSIFILKCWSFM